MEADDDTILRALIEASKTDEILKYFKFGHLAHPHAKDVSRAFALLALGIIDCAPRCPERTVALRKLLESKDAAVRAVLP